MTDRRAAGADLALLCRIVEEGATRIAARAFGGRSFLAPLIDGGFLVEDGVVDTVVCDACDDTHTAVVEYDPSSKRYWWHCPEAGRIQIEGGDADVAALAMSTGRLADELVKALGGGRSQAQQVEPGGVWRLGDFMIGTTEATGVLAIGIQDADDVERLCYALKSIRPAPAAFVFTTENGLGDAVRLPNGFRSIMLADAASLDTGSRIVVDISKLGRLIHEAEGEPTSAGGRPSQAPFVLSIQRRLAERGMTFQSERAEARAILDEWRCEYPDRRRPTLSTAQHHLRQARSKDNA